MDETLSIEASRLTKVYRRGIHGAHSLSESIFEWLFRRPSTAQEARRLAAVDCLTFSVRAGSVFGVVGANGSGKSTLLKILAGITHPTSGEVRLEGSVVSMLEASGGFDPELSGTDNVYLSGAIMGLNRQEISLRFDRIVDFAKIGPMMDTQLKRYSSGMIARLAMAIAVNVPRDIFLLDEILAVSDGRFRDKCVEVIAKLSREGRTVIFVSHNMELVRRVCDEAMLLESGRITMIGTPQQVTAAYSGVHASNENA